VIAVIGGLQWFAKGGWAMYPLLLLSIWSVFVILNRLAYFAAVVPKINRELESLFRGAALVPGRLAGDLAPLLSKAIKDGELDIEAAGFALDRELDQAGSMVSTLETISQAAPMFGLIGTVSGMVEVFNQVSTYQGAVNPSILSNGISEALIATLSGLAVAILAYMGYRYFHSRLRRWEGQLSLTVDEVRRLLRDREKEGRSPAAAVEGAH
jgi:biopolymer transport protein ExbB